MASEAQFLLKIIVTPLIVAVMTLVARRWGPTAAALLLSLPWMTGPVLFFLSYEKGHEWAAHACIGIELGCAGIAAWVLAYLAAARYCAWPLSITAAVATFAAAGAATGRLPWSLEAAALFAAASHMTAFLVTRPPATPGRGRALPWWDIPARMITTALLVTLITVSADILGPQLSGIVATYPVIISVVAAFTQQQWGNEMLTELLRTLLRSMLSFVVFFLVIGWTIVARGTVEAFLLGTLASLASSACILAVVRLGPRR
jgi:hypothetical protein